MFRCPAQTAKITKISHKTLDTAQLHWQGETTKYFETSDFNEVDEYADGLHTAVTQTAAARRCMGTAIFSSTCGIFF
jgi:hypothetical protein